MTRDAAAWSATQLNELPPNRLHWRRFRRTRGHRPTAGRNDDHVAFDRPVLGRHRELSRCTFDAEHSRSGQSNAASLGCFGERLGERRRRDMSVHRHEQRGSHSTRERRLQSSCGRRRRACGTRHRFRESARASLESADASASSSATCNVPLRLVLNRSARVALHATDEVVVHRQAARRQPAKLGDVAFDLRGEDAGRCARGATRDATRIDELDARAAGRKLVSDRAAHDAGADDGDVHMEILSGSRLWALGL